MNAVQEKAKKVKFFVFDVDGTLTNGSIYITQNGELCKEFNAKDGLALASLGKLGYKTAIITGRKSEIVEKRAAEVGISEIHQGVKDKFSVLESLCEKYGLTMQEIAYAGDDLNDLKVMEKVGFSCAPQDAVEDIKNIADFITEKKAGRGAIREMIEFILKAQDKWQEVINSYR